MNLCYKNQILKRKIRYKKRKISIWIYKLIQKKLIKFIHVEGKKGRKF
jgi:hypothetical protein